MWIVIGVALLLLAIGLSYYLRKKKTDETSTSPHDPAAIQALDARLRECEKSIKSMSQNDAEMYADMQNFIQQMSKSQRAAEPAYGDMLKPKLN